MTDKIDDIAPIVNAFFVDFAESVVLEIGQVQRPKRLMRLKNMIPPGREADLTDPQVLSRLKFARRVARLTQADAGRILEISDTGYSRIERGQTSLDGWHLVALAPHLGVTVAWLETGQPETEGPPRRAALEAASPRAESAETPSLETPERYLVCPACGTPGLADDALVPHLMGRQCSRAHSSEEATALAAQAAVDPHPWAFVTARYERDIAAVRKAMRWRIKGRSHWQTMLKALNASLELHLQLGPDKFKIRTPGLDDPYYIETHGGSERLQWASDILKSIELQEELGEPEEDI